MLNKERDENRKTWFVLVFSAIFPGFLGFRALSLMFCLFILVASWRVTANQQSDDEATLMEIVSVTVKIMRQNGYEIPDYRAINGGTDVPISGIPEKDAFFGYLDKGWFRHNSIITLHFYGATHLPEEARKELINYLVTLHSKRHCGFSLSLRMMSESYKKGKITRPDTFLELHLNRTEY